MATFCAFKLFGHLCDRDKVEPGIVWMATAFGFLIDVFLLVMLIAAWRWL